MKASDDLSDLPLLSGLDGDQISRLMSLGWKVEGDAGSPVYYPGDASNLVYLLQKGRVRLSCDTPEGRRLTLEILEPGGIFGEIALGGVPTRSTLAEAMEPSVFFVLQSERMMEFLQDCPEVMKEIIVLITHRRRRLENRLKNLLFQDAAGRLAYVLLDLHRTNLPAGVEDDGALNFSHQDLADFAGLARPTTTNLLNRFEEDGAIQLGQRSIHVQHPDRLRKHFQSPERS